jgi:hypothetical protein
MIVTPDDVGNSHENVVHNDRKIIRGHPVGAEENEIIQIGVLETNGPVDQVGDLDRPLPDSQTDDSPSGVLRRNKGAVPSFAAAAIILWRAACSQRGLAPDLQLFRGTDAVIGLPIIEQLLGILPIQVKAIGLPVRPYRSTHVWALVTVQTQPPHGVKDRAG